jgi:N-ethylmaleimide reductase
MTEHALFSPLRMGAVDLAHRVVLAPLTRRRATVPDNVPGPLAADYYAQRASPGGLLITEATQVCPEGQGYPATPGIHSAAQVAGWRRVTQAAHAKGGVIFLQLWHVGRISHPALQPGGALPVAPSAIRPQGEAILSETERAPFETPRALALDEIPGVVEAFARGARLAMEAGFDGVEVHGANGYLLEQFLQTRANTRDDAYGGSIENRARFLLEVTRAVMAVAGADRTGIRLSPFGFSNDSGEAEPWPLYSHVVRALAPLELAYLHMIEPRASGAGKGLADDHAAPRTTALFRPLWPGVMMGAGGYDRADALAATESGTADLVAFGRHFIANPDLPERLRRDVPLTPYDRSTFYGGGARGYTDYPTMDAA